MLFNQKGLLSSRKAPRILTENKSNILKMILKEELTSEEIAEINENPVDVDTAIDEDIITESAVSELVENDPEIDNPAFLAITQLAEENDDDDYKKFITAVNVVNALKDKLVNKYGAEADVLVDEVVDDAKTSKSVTVAEAVKRYAKKRRS